MQARISLARAAYSRCPIVLLDDVLAAVDAHVAAHIFRHAIRGLLRGRTLVFASHQLQFVPASDAVVVLDAGRVHASGSFAEVMDGRGLRGGAAAEAAAEAAPADVQVSVGDAVSAPPQAPRSSNLLRAMMSDRADVDAQLAATTAHAAPPPLADLPPAAAASSDALVEEAGDATPVSPSAAAASSGAATPVALAPALPDTLSAAAAAVKPGGSGGELIHAEDREHGAVPAGIYWTYLASFGGPAFNAMALSLVLTTGVSLGTDVWLSAWSTGRGGFSLGLYLGAYAALTTGSALLSLCYSLSWARGGVNAARKLHSDMLRCILRSPSAWRGGRGLPACFLYIASPLQCRSSIRRPSAASSTASLPTSRTSTRGCRPPSLHTSPSRCASWGRSRCRCGGGTRAVCLSMDMAMDMDAPLAAHPRPPRPSFFPGSSWASSSRPLSLSSSSGPTAPPLAKSR